MLPVKCILALYHARVIGISQVFCRSNQGIGHFKVRNRRELDGRILPAGAFHSDGSRGNHNVPALYIHIHSAAGPHPDECMGAAQHQFFHCNGGRWSANAGGGHAHHLTVQIAGVCNVLPAVGNQPGIVKIAGYPGTALGISRHNDIPAHIPFPDL